MPPRGHSVPQSGGKKYYSAGGVKTRKAPKVTKVVRSAPRKAAPVYRAPIRRTAARPIARSVPRSTPKGNTSGPIKPVKKPMSLTDWLKKDSEYQDQLRQFGKTWSSFLADVGVRKGRVGSEYELGKKKMGEQRLRDLESMEDDYAGRGLLQSGLYGERVGQYEKDYNTNLSELERNRKTLLEDIASEQSNFQREQDLEKERARKSAAARRAATF